ncbi:TetR/AcrR family transcriptional regulator [Streptomyces sp. NPDC002688]|uniref:TetR/AcrR family transcriptional regulator n=1 Tax=Streptomyces sp. NPDC002688 TaxID=3154423 RepID=UPI00332114BA
MESITGGRADTGGDVGAGSGTGGGASGVSGGSGADGGPGPAGASGARADGASGVGGGSGADSPSGAGDDGGSEKDRGAGRGGSGADSGPSGAGESGESGGSGGDGGSGAGGRGRAGARSRTSGGRSRTSGGRSRYHHGDLRNALIEAAVELATEGGPERVVLREAARSVGVSPTAAYRHFEGQGELLEEVKIHGQQALAASMSDAVRAVPAADDPGEEAVRRTEAIGRGYVRFAIDHPGLYRTAFCRTAAAEERDFTGLEAPDAGAEFAAFRELSDTLDTLVATGRMAQENRPAAEVAAWSTVHGLSLLILDGPLALLPPDQRDAVVDRTLTAIVAGLIR